MRMRLALILLAACSTAGADPAPIASVHFSPHGGCSQAVVDFLGTAHRTIRFSAYGFTLQPIAQALVAAHARGVDVQAVLDRSDMPPRSRVNDLRAGGIPVAIDAKHPIMHDKYIVVDGQSVETGSYNYTAQGESNAENCLFIRDQALAREYAADWATHRKHAVAL